LIGGIALAYLFDKNNGIRISRTLKLIAIVLLIAFTFLAVSDVYVFSRFIESSSRVVGFVDKISNLEPIYAFLGVGIGNQVHYFDNVLHAKYGFVNGFGSLLVQSGLLGLFLFLSFHLYLYFKLSYRGKVTTLVFLAAMFVENVYMGFWMVMFYILMFFEFKTRKNEI
ncbi:hypothetical protein AB6H46_23775, partial [Vibrio alginolyticus]|uniref:hypothetical protein n=1 Tax=Vibrio alginolyticus TaxID=663 RepID=UPI00354C0822